MAQQRLDASEKKLTGWHVLLWICGFFAVVFTANGAFVYYASTSWPGVVEQSPYQASQNYNNTLKEAQAQADRQWQMGIELKRRQNDVFLIVEARDKLDNPITDLVIEANIGRPATESFDRQLTLSSKTGGTYQGTIGTLDPGRWRIKLEALEDSEVMFQTLQTVTLK
ncbi:Nitrogen fixation protein FixH [Cohaesibacter sp. ES.047]|uniref:FixH family protein n=1 Tax=Cohaesibacter sp. ES.047 TaxID=1798205 RepID=UPI000BC036BB|nr:FixH family protein [Cohaesibacter sp. ES.047]SNY91940.1 Nitrogen fixation protein FixH [Cohaesibacter sp. ES.047]